MLLVGIALVLVIIPLLGYDFDSDTGVEQYQNGQLESTRDVYADSIVNYIKHNYSVLALRNATIIDGTGAPPKEEQTIIVRSGKFHGYKR